jgi:phosphatidylinositol-3-phosphatase
MECGARRGTLPPAVLARIDAMQESKSREMATAKGSLAGLGLGESDEDEADDSEPINRYMPTPRAAAVAILGLLAFGVVVGAATSPPAQSAGVTSVLLESPVPAPVESAPEEEATTPEAAPVEEPAAAAATAPYPETLEEEPEAEEPVQAPSGPAPLPPEPELPPVKHVFMVVLGDHGYEEAFGESSPAPYLAKTLPSKGELLPNYYAVAPGGLANEIALVSGQGPTLETAANCPNYTDVVPATVSLEEEQVEGNGCVYPADTKTLPGQLVGQALFWKAYVEGIGSGPERASGCRHPALGGPDANQLPLPADPYETWRNPFVYFHSLLDGPECAEGDVDYSRLAPDLKKAETTPAVSYIVPSACHDGSELPCEPGQPAGLAAAEPFLKTVIGEIKASPAYKEGGLIAITFAQAPQIGPGADPRACCATPPYPNLPAPAPEATTPKPAAPTVGSVEPTGGGGRVGLLLLSPFVEPGSVNETGYFNHFSLLASIEDLFGLERIGYAANPALAVFDETIYNAAAPEAPASAAQRAIVSLLGRAG